MRNESVLARIWQGTSRSKRRRTYKLRQQELQDTHLPHRPCASFESAGGEAGGEAAGDVALFRCGSHLHARGVDPAHLVTAQSKQQTGMAHWHTALAQTQIAEWVAQHPRTRACARVMVGADLLPDGTGRR